MEQLKGVAAIVAAIMHNNNISSVRGRPFSRRRRIMDFRPRFGCEKEAFSKLVCQIIFAILFAITVVAALVRRLPSDVIG